MKEKREKEKERMKVDSNLMIENLCEWEYIHKHNMKHKK